MKNLLLPVLASCSVVVAQDSTEESFIPNYAVGGAYYIWSDDADFSDLPGSVQQQEAGFYANVPIFQTEGFRATAGVSYRWNQLEFNSEAFPFAGESLDLHRVDVPFNVWADLNDRWKLWLRAQPGVYSDFDDISGDDFILTSLALLSYQWNDALRVAFGGFYSRDLGEERVLPAVGIIYEPNPHWYLALTFPRVEVAWAPNEDWLVAGRATLSGAGWNVANPAGGEDLDLNYRIIRTGIGVDRRLSGPWWAYIDAGVQVGQEIEIDGGGLDITEELDASAYATVGVKLRF